METRDAATLHSSDGQAGDVIPERMAHLGRQPVVDRDGILHGFELLFRDDVKNHASIDDEDAATAQVVIRTIGEFGVRAALGGHKGYLNTSRATLLADALTLIPPEHFVFELPRDIDVDAELLGRIVQLHAKSYRFVLDDVVRLDATFAKLLPYVEAVKIDVSRCPPELLPKLAQVLKSTGKQLIAMKVESSQVFEAAKELGFDLFQGYFFTRPQMLTARRAGAPRHALLKLLQLLSSDPSVTQLEKELKLIPGLVIHLMRLANSGESSIGRKPAMLRDAIIATGTDQIMRWTQMLLYADARKVPLEDDPLLQLAATRARFMELAAAQLPDSNRPDTDEAFLAGVFSLVDAVFGESLERTLEDLSLSPHIRAAILHREGTLGSLLLAVQALEQGDWATLDTACVALAPLTSSGLAALALEAASWATKAGQKAESSGLERLDD
jgi:c-di-GMP-related signal transduction protein